jgi:antitoxin component of RelBE/YafQ-DinJ toxin-antitoxin module
MEKVVIQARIEKGYKEQLEHIAQTYGLSVSSILRIVIISIVKSRGLTLRDSINLAPDKPVYRSEPK